MQNCMHDLVRDRCVSLCFTTFEHWPAVFVLFFHSSSGLQLLRKPHQETGTLFFLFFFFLVSTNPRTQDGTGAQLHIFLYSVKGAGVLDSNPNAQGRRSNCTVETAESKPALTSALQCCQTGTPTSYSVELEKTNKLKTSRGRTTANVRCIWVKMHRRKRLWEDLGILSHLRWFISFKLQSICKVSSLIKALFISTVNKCFNCFFDRPFFLFSFNMWFLYF